MAELQNCMESKTDVFSTSDTQPSHILRVDRNKSTGFEMIATSFFQDKVNTIIHKDQGK